MLFGIHKDHFYTYWLNQLIINTQRNMEIYMLVKKLQIQKYKTIRKQNYHMWKSIQTEDLNIIEGMQDGGNSPVYNGGNFSNNG